MKLQEVLDLLQEEIVDIYHKSVDALIRKILHYLDKMKNGQKLNITKDVLMIIPHIKPTIKEVQNFEGKIILKKYSTRKLNSNSKPFAGSISYYPTFNKDIDIKINPVGAKIRGLHIDRVLRHEIAHLIIAIESMIKRKDISKNIIENKQMKDYIFSPYERDQAISSFISKMKHFRVKLPYKNYEDLLKAIFKDKKEYLDNKGMNRLMQPAVKKYLQKRFYREGITFEKLYKAG